MCYNLANSFSNSLKDNYGILIEKESDNYCGYIKGKLSNIGVNGNLIVLKEEV